MGAIGLDAIAATTLAGIANVAAGSAMTLATTNAGLITTLQA